MGLGIHHRSVSANDHSHPPQVAALSNGMGETVLEHPRFSAGNTSIPKSGGSKYGNIGAGFAPLIPSANPTAPELAAVVAAWPDLPPAVRAGIVAMVKAATPPTAPSGSASGASVSKT